MPFTFSRTYTFVEMPRLVLWILGVLVFGFGMGGLNAQAQVNQSPSTEEAQVQQAENTVVTSRRNNYVREGPGSFHELTEIVKRDVPLLVLDTKNGWIKVELPDGRTGWISRTSIYEGGAAPNVSREELGEQWTSSEATDTEVAAAVRGFQMRAEGLNEGSVEELLAYLQQRPVYGDAAVEQFQRPLQASGSSSLDLGDLDVELSPYDPTVDEQKVGLAVGARLSSMGLVHAPDVRRYLSLIAVHLTEDTPYYDWNFDVVIVEGDGPDAFACPGGIIVLTRGVFSHFQDEAELAGLLAHEIAHVVRQHGKKEMGEREVKQKAEDAFAELDQMTEDEEEDPYAQVEDDLEQVMRESYERIVNDRLLEYEKEADRIAAAFMAEAGYDPRGLVDAVGHIAALRSSDPDLFDSDYLEVQNIQERQEHIRTFIEREGAEGGQRLPNRFTAFAGEMQQ